MWAGDGGQAPFDQGLEEALRQMPFLEVVCGIQKTARVTSSQIYQVAIDEFLSTTAPDSPIMQAPRHFMSSVVSL